MAEYVLMPKLGFNMDAGQLVAWRKKEGESIKRGEVFFVILTDKTAMEVEATSDAVLLKILAQEGDEVPVTLPIAIIGNAQDDISALVAAAAGNNVAGTATLAVAAQSVGYGAKAAGDSKENNPTINVPTTAAKLSPRARKYLAAQKLEIPSASVTGTGFQGGITQKDLEAYLTNNTDASITKRADVLPQDDTREVLRTVPYSGMRKVIGDKLSRSQASAPHVSFTTPVDCQELVGFREQVNSVRNPKLSILDFIVAASSLALQTFPQVNASLQQDRIVLYKDVNIGVAVALDAGLIVPVIRKTQQKKLAEIAAATRELTEKARSGHLSPDEYQGGTFTVSNLGMMDVEYFTSIINPPEAAILGVGAMSKRTKVITCDGEDRVFIRAMLNLTVTVDHRLIDGRDAVLFLSEVKRLLENPVFLFL